MSGAFLIVLGVWLIVQAFVFQFGPAAIVGIFAIGIGAWVLTEGTDR